MIEGISCTAEYLVLPVIGWSVFIQVCILPVAEKTGKFAFITSQQGVFSLPFYIISCAQCLQGLCHFFPGIVGIIRYTQFSFLSAFSRYQNYTVCTAGTVNSCRRCIFQYSHILNIGCGNVADRLYRETVYDKQRSIVTCDRTTTTYANLHFCVRRTFGSGDLYTRHFTLQGFCCRSYGNGAQYFGTNRSNGTCDIFPFGCTIADNNDFI